MRACLLDGTVYGCLVASALSFASGLLVSILLCHSDSYLQALSYNLDYNDTIYV